MLDTIDDQPEKSLIPLLLTGLAFLFYLYTLAPTVLWGDDANFQRIAFDGSLKPDGGGHWLWLQIARLFVHLPVGDVAYRANLLSAAAAALTVFLLYATARSLGRSPLAAAAAGASLAVSHTFWMHAVRAEVYTLLSAILLVELWLWSKWRQDHPWPLRLAVLFLGAALLGHQMAVLCLPALAYLIWMHRDWLSRKELALLACLGLVGLLPFLAVIQRQIGAGSLYSSLALYFTHSDVDFSPAFFDFTLATLPRDLALWIGFTGLQFVGPAGILGLWAVYRARSIDIPNPAMWRAIAIFYVTGVIFAFSYHVNDQFVFYLPTYVAFALAVGLGWDLARQARKWLDRPAARATLFLSLIALPPIIYYSLAMAFAAWGINPLDIRQLPGREPNRYFLWPAKNGYTGAWTYGVEALKAASPDSTILADHTPFETLSYLQGVEGLRRDVHLVKIEPGEDINILLRSIPSGSAVFLADRNPRYYNLTGLSEPELQPVGPIYALKYR